MTDSDIDALCSRLSARLPQIDMARPPVPAPAPRLTEDALATVEDQLAFALPPVLSEVYRRVANGGFGPGYGLMGVGANGFADDQGQTADARYALFRAPDSGLAEWPDGVLPICHFGCGVYHCVRATRGDVLVWEPNVWQEGTPPDTALFLTGTPLLAWFDRWSRGAEVDMYLLAEAADASDTPTSLADLGSRGDTP